MKALDRCEDGSVLSGIDIFSALSGEDLRALVGKMQCRSYEPGEAIFREGESGSELFVVASGLVAVSVRSKEDEEIELARVGRGAFFGEMAILERAPRSATCKAIEATSCLALASSEFEALISERPSAAVAVLDRMLGIAAGRLMKTGSFLSQMVQWGDEARKRAITDAATGLFNRRYLEDSFPGLVARAGGEGPGLSFAMFDLDRFGKLNAAYGAEFCDHLIVVVSEAFRRVFGEEDILVRYGGDEFCFIVLDSPEGSSRKCESVCAELRSLRFDEHPELRVSCSIGLASYPLGGRGPDELKERADKALYLAKEGGRDRAVAWAPPAPPPYEGPKRDIPTVAQKNRVVSRIVKALEERDFFLVIGHKDPDEDCVSSLVAFALLATKLGKKAAIAFGDSVQENFAYLVNICKYNSISILRPDEDPYKRLRASSSALVLVDTPKPEMIDRRALYVEAQLDPAVLKIELDHHLASDSGYFGDPDYRLVYEASSTCEIIGMLALKMGGDEALLARYQIEELMSRNLVLAILSGMIGDSQMGRYLKTRRERWFYERFSSMFEALLERKTRAGSGNFASKEQVFDALAALTKDEDACYRFMFERAATIGRVSLVALDSRASRELFATYGKDVAVSVSKAIVDALAEGSGCMGMVAYYDDPSLSSFAQFRLRRAQGFTSLDLREAIARLGMTNGGGHPGAVGFRVEREGLPDLVESARGFAAILSDMAEKEAPAAPRAV